MPLIAGLPARWHSFDFEAGARPDGTYPMKCDWVEREPAPVNFLEAWHARWDAAEEYFFAQVRPRSAFDLVVAAGD